MADFGLSAFAMFFMQSASFLSFQRALEQGQGRSNCQTLFGVEKIPSDNYIRDMLDGADPASLAPCFERMEQLLLETRHARGLRPARRQNPRRPRRDRYFCSQKITCPRCQTRKRSNGKIESYHSMLAATVVAPGQSKVVPLRPEFIAKQDGAEKQDCERAAVKRWHATHGARRSLCVQSISPTIFSPATASSRRSKMAATTSSSPARKARTRRSTISSTAPEPERHQEKIHKGKTSETFRYRFIEKVPLRDSKDAVLVNWIGFEILDAKGVVKYKTALVTSLPVKKSNVAEIMACGRARWKIENESFNVLKNHGYELEHKLGHGESFLAMTLAALNMLAFAWHTVLDSSWNRLGGARGRRRKSEPASSPISER